MYTLYTVNTSSHIPNFCIHSTQSTHLLIHHILLIGCTGSISPPLILIGPGTGVAPFVGFIQHRAVLKMDRQTSGREVSTGLWRGGFEIEKEDLPRY